MVIIDKFKFTYRHPRRHTHLAQAASPISPTMANVHLQREYIAEATRLESFLSSMGVNVESFSASGRAALDDLCAVADQLQVSAARGHSAVA